MNERLERARLYLCTGDQPDSFLDAVLGAGVDVLQLREKDMEAQPQLAIAERFRAACDRHDALFVVNDRAELASAAGADGVHLGQDDLDPSLARPLLAPGAIIGRSTHTPAELRRAFDEDVDYVCVGPVYETPTKPGRPAAGLDLVRLAAEDCPKPWFAIGGIELGTIGAVVEAGARRIVVVRAITGAADPGAAVSELLRAL